MTDPKPYLVSSHFKEDLAWFNTCPYEYVVYSKQPEVAKQQIPENRIIECANVGMETGSYLSYILEHYHDLPEHIAFIHGHETAYHQAGTIVQAIQYWQENHSDLRFMSLNFPQERYFSIANWYLLSERCPVVNDGHGNCVESIWNARDHSTIGLNLGQHCGAKIWRDMQVGTDMPMEWAYTAHCQFVTHRDNILRIPLRSWQRAWNLLNDETYVNSFGGHWWIGFGWEHLWSTILNLGTDCAIEPAHLDRWKRLR